jgi:hypothetical protein
MIYKAKYGNGTEATSQTFWIVARFWVIENLPHFNPRI